MSYTILIDVKTTVLNLFLYHQNLYIRLIQITIDYMLINGMKLMLSGRNGIKHLTYHTLSVI